MKRLRATRERSGLTQAELAERLGTTQQTIARWEAGKAEPSLASLRDLAINLSTTVEHLLGRESVLEHQTTNPFAWLTGDKSGYWGNIGILLKNRKFSTWYPITTQTMETLFSRLQSVERNSWLIFQTLNNKMVIWRPLYARTVTFLNEAEDDVDGDWEVGPDDVEGWPQEIYECMDHLLTQGSNSQGPDEGFSTKLMAATQDIIKTHGIDENKMIEMCSMTRLVYTDGSSHSFLSSERCLAEILSDFDIGANDGDSIMLHLDDNYGERSLFLSLDLIGCLEIPLLLLKKGLEDQFRELSEEDGSIKTGDISANARKTEARGTKKGNR